MISIKKNHCKLLLSFRRQILWETPFLPTPGSVSVPTSPPPSLVPPPCLFAASPHAPEWLQFWGAMSGFPFWEREEAVFAQGGSQPPAHRTPRSPKPCCLCLMKHHAWASSSAADWWSYLWQQNCSSDKETGPLDVHRETKMWSYPLSKSSTVNWHESPDPLVTGMVIGRSWVPLSLCPIYDVPGFAFNLSLHFLPPPQ